VLQPIAVFVQVGREALLGRVELGHETSVAVRPSSAACPLAGGPVAADSAGLNRCCFARLAALSGDQAALLRWTIPESAALAGVDYCNP
jgi:hypothetical protein